MSLCPHAFALNGHSWLAARYWLLEWSARFKFASSWCRDEESPDTRQWLMYLSWRVCCVLHFRDSGPLSHSFHRWCQFSSGDANTAHACTFLRSLPRALWCETRFVLWCGDMFRFESGRPKWHSQIDVSFGRRKSYVGSGWSRDMLWGIVGAFNSPMYFSISWGWLESNKEPV